MAIFVLHTQPSNESLAFRVALRIWCCLKPYHGPHNPGHCFSKASLQSLMGASIVLKWTLCLLGTESHKVWKQFCFLWVKHRYLLPLCSICCWHRLLGSHTKGFRCSCQFHTQGQGRCLTSGAAVPWRLSFAIHLCKKQVKASWIRAKAGAAAAEGRVQF